MLSMAAAVLEVGRKFPMGTPGMRAKDRVKIELENELINRAAIVLGDVATSHGVICFDVACPKDLKN